MLIYILVFVRIQKQIVAENQSRLKKHGDWQIFPKTIQYVADGRFSRDENDELYFDEKLIPFGVQENSKKGEKHA